MNICIDGYAALNLPGTFIGSYSSEIIRQLSTSEIPQIPHVIFQHEDYSQLFDKNSSWYVPVEVFIDRQKDNYQSLPEYFRRNDINIYHSLNNGFSVPEEKVCPYIVSIHSLYPVENKFMVDKKYYNKFLRAFPNALDRSDKIIAVSDFMKKELIRLFNIPENKIHVLYPLISPMYKLLSPESSKNLIASRYGIKHDFILYCGNIHRSKRLDKVINVFRILSRRHKDLRLVIAGEIGGKKSIYYNELLSLCQELKIRDKIIFTGLIPREDTVYFYNRAKCVISFSEYDGYPLSLAEAVRCKTPVIAALTPIVNEVLNNCAVTCDISKVDEIADFIGYICSNNLFRNNLINKMKLPATSSLDEYIDFYNKF